MFVRRSFALLMFGFVLIWDGPRLAHAREFPPGAARLPGDLPPSRLRAQIERLPGPAANRAMAWLSNFHFTDQDIASMEADAEGGIFYSDHFQLAPIPNEAQ